MVKKNIPFKIDNEGVYLEYTEIWNETKKSLDIKFHSQTIYENKYIKTKVKAFSSMINTLFSGNDIPKNEIITFVLHQLVLILY